jgi:1-hydroxycarotenoid 3,4-desaturase
MAGLASGAGARIQTGAEVRHVRIEHGRATGVELADGTRLEADAVVLNVEPDAIRTGLLGTDLADALGPAEGASRSTSAITWCVVATARGFDLAHHTVFFSDDYGREFRELDAGKVPEDPTIYVCAQDRADGATPGGPERLFVLINAPPRGDDPTFEEERDSWTQRTFQRLATLELQVDVQDSVMTTPQEFARRFPGSGGALYGATTRGWRAAFQRPAAKTQVPGVFLAGGGSHPGAGLPMVCLSGRNAASHVLREFPSTPRSRTTGTAGGTSMGSVTTADTP